MSDDTAGAMIPMADLAAYDEELRAELARPTSRRATIVGDSWDPTASPHPVDRDHSHGGTRALG